MNEANGIRLLVPASIVVFMVCLLVVPVVRMRLRYGRWGITLHERRNPAQRVVGVGMGIVLTGLASWGALVALVDFETLGIWNAPLPAIVAGVGLLLLGMISTAIAQAEMRDSWRIGIDREPTALVTSGLFRVVRNPIFTGMLALSAGVAVLTPSPWTLAAWVYGATLIAVQARLEEQHLVSLHGDAYREYASTVGRFLPGLGKLGRGAV